MARRRWARMGIWELLAVGAICALSACAGGGAVAGPAAASTSTPPAPSPTTRPTPPACQISQLKLILVDTSSASGRVRLLFQFTNTSTDACALTGYPVFTMPSTSVKIADVPGAYSWQTVSISSVALSLNGSAYFAIEAQPSAEVAGQTCAAATPTIAPPGSATSFIAPVSVTTCDGVVSVSPLVATPDAL